jgi:hypothetical protein
VQAGQYMVEVPVASLQDTHMKLFELYIHTQVQELIFSMISSYYARSAATNILSQDPLFKKH